MPLLLLQNWDWIKFTDTYNNTCGLSANNVIDKNIRDLKIELGVDNIPIENHRLPNMYWMPKMYKTLLKPDSL